MAVFDLFSKRQRRLRGEVPDVYVYDSIPEAFRVQCVQILQDAIGPTGTYSKNATQNWELIHDTLAREYGEFQLASGRTHEEAATRFFLDERDHEKALDFIELAFRCVDKLCRDAGYRHHASPKVSVDDALEELNARFREHGIGYQYESGELIRIDSQLMHAEAVKPALHLLRAKQFAGANAEYLRAFEHYRHGRFEEALADCLKAFESVMKAICHKRGWSYTEADTAKRLIEICFANGLIPSYLQSEFASLRTTLESGVPTVRNKQSGHGTGTTPRSVPLHLASYVLHLTASSMLLLAEADAQLP